MINNELFNNSAAQTGGAALISLSPNATVMGNHFYSNTSGYIGGISISDSPTATLQGNAIYNNVTDGRGGGIGFHCSDDSTLFDNAVFSNTSGSGGGGIYVGSSDNITVTDNMIHHNVARRESGGGICFHGVAGATMVDNQVHGNAGYYGGGVSFSYADSIVLSGNVVYSNTATSDGGGVSISGQGNITLTNNVIAENRITGSGSGAGIYVGPAVDARILHTTVARNGGGNGEGIHVWGSSLSLTNTILVSHTVGISVTENSTATLEATVWGTGAWRNDRDWGGDGYIFTGTVNLWGNPVFLNPDAGDYHIDVGSAAVDLGVDAGIVTDVDGQPRPIGTGYDIGADEFPAALLLAKQASPNPVHAGGPVTYTIHITNTGVVNLHATVTDVLPSHITPTGTLTWTPTITAPGGTWTQVVVVTVDEDHSGPLSNTVWVTTEEGATGTGGITVTAFYKRYLPFVLRDP
jgi:uncharacterized repeat protein (TIGR01451 family)